MHYAKVDSTVQRPHPSKLLAGSFVVAGLVLLRLLRGRYPQNHQVDDAARRESLVKSRGEHEDVTGGALRDDEDPDSPSRIRDTSFSRSTDATTNKHLRVGLHY